MAKSIKTITPEEYANMIKVCYDAKQPLYISGPPGIGKSAIPRQVFKAEADRLKLRFAEWSDLQADQRMDAIKNPEKWFIFMDARTSQMDTTSLQGIPNMSNTKMLENIPYSWAVYMTQANAHGVILFDELNLAAPLVQAITYSVILDRVISDRRMSDNVYVMAAGNRQQDKAHTFDMPFPLRDRFCELELEANAEHWLEWAKKEGVNPHIISFISWKNAWLFHFDPQVHDKPTTPRGIVRASDMIRDLDFEKDSGQVYLRTSASTGNAFAVEFQAYISTYAKLNWSDLFKNLKDPKKQKAIREMSADIHYAIMGGLVERYAKDPGNAEQLEKLYELAKCLPKTFTVNCLRQWRDVPGSQLKKLFTSHTAEFAKEYGKLIIRDLKKA